MHKRSGETQCGYITRYFHSAHNGASNDQRTSFVNCIKHDKSKIKALIKSNFDSKKTGFDYKRIRKDAPPEPMHLDTVTTTTPNDSGIAELLTVAVLLNRTPFWSEPAKVVSLHKKVVGAYIFEDQRNNLFTHLKTELELLESPDSETNTKPSWGSRGGSAQPTETPGNKRTITVFNAMREDHLNKVTPPNPSPLSPPKVRKSSAQLSRTASIIMGASPARKAAVTFSAQTKESTSSPQRQKDIPRSDGNEEKATQQPNPKTTSTSTPSPTLNGRNIFPEVPPQQNRATQDTPHQNGTKPRTREEESQSAHGKTQQETPPDTHHQPSQTQRDTPKTSPAPRHHPQRENDSNDASMLSGISQHGSRTSDFDMFDEEEIITPKIKKKLVPKREGGQGESYMWLWIKGTDDTMPLDNLCTKLSKVVAVLVSKDGDASLQCVYDGDNPTWTNPDTKEKIPLTPIRLPEDVPTVQGLLEKYIKVQWSRMLSDRRGQKDRNGNKWKPMSISGTLLLNSVVCDKYLCNKVNSNLGSDGLRMKKPIQVLRTEIVACVICVSNSVCLVAVTSFINDAFKDTEQFMFSKGKHQAYMAEDHPELQISRRPAREPDVPKKYRSKGLTDVYRSLKMTITIKTEDENSEIVWSVLSLMQKMGVLKKYLGPQVKILGLGSHGPKPDDKADQAERNQDLRINMAFLCCTKAVVLNGLQKPNKTFYAK